MGKGICLLIIDVIVHTILIIFAPVLRAADRLFVKSVDWLLRYQQRWQKYCQFAPALKLKVPGLALNADRCFVRFYRLLMGSCRSQSGRCKSHAMQTGFTGNNSDKLLMAS